jgi:hypothetical protein
MYFPQKNGLRPQKGGLPCGQSPRWKSPPRYADNAKNRARFGGVPPLCPPVIAKNKLANSRKDWWCDCDSCKAPAKSRSRIEPPARAQSDVKSTRAKKVRLSSFLRKVVEDGTQIGHGRQADIYKYKGNAVKIFKTRNVKAFNENVNFLLENQDMKVVPKYIASNEDDAWIEMEVLEDFEPLTLARYKLMTVEEKNALLNALAEARAKLPSDKHYTDLSKLDNIAIKQGMQGGKAIFTVKFYEGGTSSVEPNKKQVVTFMREVIGQLRAQRLAAAKPYKLMR